LDRSGLFSSEKLFSVTYSQLHEHLAHWEQLEHASFVGQVYNQSAGFIIFLLEGFEKEFQSFLAKLRNTPRRKMNVLFGQCFHLSANEVHQQWIDQLRTTQLPPYCKPPEWLQAVIESQLVPFIITEGDAFIDQRRIAIRSMGNLGYPWSTSVLVEIAEDGLDAMQDEAHRALENLAGRSFDNSHQAIRAWWESLPADVKAIQ
jgi:hypothetical protein